MLNFKTLAAIAAAASLIASPAVAGTVTRSSSALPAATKLTPVAQVRADTRQKRKTNAQAEGIGLTEIAIGVVAAGAVAGGIVAATSGDDNKGLSGAN